MNDINKFKLNKKLNIWKAFSFLLLVLKDGFELDSKTTEVRITFDDETFSLDCDLSQFLKLEEFTNAQKKFQKFDSSLQNSFLSQKNIWNNDQNIDFEINFTLTSEKRDQKFKFKFVNNDSVETLQSFWSNFDEKHQKDDFQGFGQFLSISGVYANEFETRQLTRVVGYFHKEKQTSLDYHKELKERLESDHRKIGIDLGIFTFINELGTGFPIWLENGLILKSVIKKYLQKMEKKYGFQEVSTPIVGSKDLYIKSGHLEHYHETMFPSIELPHQSLILRPMACPHHITLFASRNYSYRDLPIRISEHAQLFRYEKSGALTGLQRVRAMELTDSHIFVTQNQVASEFMNAFNLIQEVIQKFDIEIDYVELALHDPNDKEGFFDNPQMWKEAENSLRNVLTKNKIKFVEKIGEAAFYGPKVDVQVKTLQKHIITLSTIQLDFLLPQKFDATYIDENNQKKTPILIHRGLIGTYERFLSILLEQTRGNLPFWLAPQQFVIIPLNQEINDFAFKVKKLLDQNDFRVKLDQSNERLAKKIRTAQVNKIKFQIVIGEKEKESETLSIRAYKSEEVISLPLSDLVPHFEKLI